MEWLNLESIDDKKMDWATFWTIFSQTHLVTLVGGSL
jgi:hypothetical protein